MRLLLVGPPGAGKGTQAARLAERLAVPHVASGNLLREVIAKGTPVGEQARLFIERGELVPDDLVIQIISERLKLPDAKGFVLDGFPRTGAQAKALDRLLAGLNHPLRLVVCMDVPTEELFLRLTGRRICSTCQTPYHLTNNPPKVDELCDQDGTKLITRVDDKPETVRRRIEVFEREAAELKAYYDHGGSLVQLDGTGSMDEVTERILKAVEAAR